MQGVDPSQIIRLPGEGADQKTLDEFYERLGRPADPKSYSMPKLDDPKYANAGLDPALLEGIAAAAHKAGLPNAQFSAIVDAYAELRGAEYAKLADAARAELDAQSAKLKADWGQAHAINTQKAELALKALDQKGRVEGLSAWLEANGLKGDPTITRLLFQIGAGMTEEPLVAGTPANMPLTPDHARAEIARLKGDPAFVNAWLDGSHPGHKDAIAKMARLNEFISPEAA